MINEDGNKVKYTISNNNIKKYLSGLEGEDLAGRGVDLEVHLSALMVLPEIIEQSIPAEVHADYEKVDGKRSADNSVDRGLLIHRYYGAISYKGKIYRVKTTLKEFANRSYKPAAYNYELSKIEVVPEDLSSTSKGAQESTSNSDETTTLGVAKLLKGVEKSYDPGKFLLEESAKRDEEIARNKGALQFRVAMEVEANEPTKFRIRTEEAPVKTGVGYKVFVVKNGKLYPPMVANADREATQVGVWLDADANEQFIVGGKEGVDADVEAISRELGVDPDELAEQGGADLRIRNMHNVAVAMLVFTK